MERPDPLDAEKNSQQPGNDDRECDTCREAPRDWKTFSPQLMQVAENCRDAPSNEMRKAVCESRAYLKHGLLGRGSRIFAPARVARMIRRAWLGESGARMGRKEN